MEYLIYKIINIINGKIYIGQHCTENIDDGYMGSGKVIKQAIKKYGKEKFKKEILYIFDNEEEMLNMEREIVNEEFVNRLDTYNLTLGGGSLWHQNGMVCTKDKDENICYVSVDDPRYLSGELVGINSGYVNVQDKEGNTIRVSKYDPRYLSGELKCPILVKDKKDNILRVRNDDPRYLSGELKFFSKGKVTVKDKDGNFFQVSKDDPRYLSGELKMSWVGKKHSEETKRKIGEASSKRNKGKNNANYGKCWIHNLELKKTKMIHKNALEKWLNKGWIKGGKLKWD